METSNLPELCRTCIHKHTCDIARFSIKNGIGSCHFYRPDVTFLDKEIDWEFREYELIKEIYIRYTEKIPREELRYGVSYDKFAKEAVKSGEELINVLRWSFKDRYNKRRKEGE